MIVNFDYKFCLEFEEPVSNHYFSLKVTPRVTPYYKILNMGTSDNLFHTKDGFGNIISFGSIKEEHTTFEITTSGQIEFFDEYYDIDDIDLSKLYLYESQFIKYSDSFLGFINNIEYNCDIQKFTKYIVGMIFSSFTYQRGVTTTECTIDTLLIHKKGVCQDFAHLMIAVLRYYGIAARYVSGFVSGEGESHAWVEYFDGKIWRGADPTHNILIAKEPYIKVAHGKDAYDTAMNKGVFVGKTTQNLIITASVEQ
jgi:transglutaminase-like putative cysteine protease